ncbi:cdkn1a interacting zinc finger protein 1b isoform X1 [Pseudoliparis swirei]|uniref:cdkn1a interacting zinc finger protein 1b isoform X1 n=1 Tax=Pseudoliparis swirei TaxID=2059687 RepID=UPI0024BE2A80|nr:cdkn1a interacting zinc finger protein 1b isoform X1 [Pseudoliparis swirei]XP_056275118.1 cdkn1a interacting zinc finger protein 1b isoform X1 [Pseudoliparis swirei]
MSKVNMVRQQGRPDRCFVPTAQSSVAWVRVPVESAHGRQQADGSTTTEEERGERPEGGPGETKRSRLDGTEEAAALTNRERAPGPCGQPAEALRSRLSPPVQQAAELRDDSRAAETVRSLKVTIQQSSESREFRQTGDRQTGGLHCHVCDLTCRSLQVFQEHMTESEHLRKLKEMTHSICLNTHTLQDRGRRPDAQRWCDTCQTHFSDDIIIHRRTKQHKVCKQLCRPFCPVCTRHFRTPRKFVEHMKSAEHKEQVQLEEELITVDAVGCFKEDEEEEEVLEQEEKNKVLLVEENKEVLEEEVEEEIAEEDGGGGKEEEKETEDQPTNEAADTQETDSEEYDPETTYGSRFVLPVSGFFCQLCNKFFYKETTARRTHCRTHTHYQNLQGHRARRRREDRSALL